jgi:hypothetical protein
MPVDQLPGKRLATGRADAAGRMRRLAGRLPWLGPLVKLAWLVCGAVVMFVVVGATATVIFLLSVWL